MRVGFICEDTLDFSFFRSFYPLLNLLVPCCLIVVVMGDSVEEQLHLAAEYARIKEVASLLRDNPGINVN